MQIKTRYTIYYQVLYVHYYNSTKTKRMITEIYTNAFCRLVYMQIFSGDVLLFVKLCKKINVLLEKKRVYNVDECDWISMSFVQKFKFFCFLKVESKIITDLLLYETIWTLHRERKRNFDMQYRVCRVEYWEANRPYWWNRMTNNGICWKISFKACLCVCIYGKVKSRNIICRLHIWNMSI